MTYYRVEFPSINGAQPVSKRFRTEEKAKKHAKRGSWCRGRSRSEIESKYHHGGQQRSGDL